MSQSEALAEPATTLESFPINLVEIKRSVADILSVFGRGLMFFEYTTHDISHINDMLATLDWLIPAETRVSMSPAEWLMLVLSIYFHDMGLVVTEDEFSSRSTSGFRDFCERKLFSGSEGDDYKAKVSLLPPEQSERFLYQEFVRANHGRRVRSWIEGRPSYELGYAAKQMLEVDRLLSPLDAEFRRDLALICESHNLDDLDDTSKYKVSQPYGNSDKETVNVQYCGVILRTVDLIQITRRRAPSVLYRLINPSDPVSQTEWIKQNAVRRVRPQAGKDREGNASSDVPSDTIEVFATFKNEEGFFGLTSYLKYASGQLSASFDVMKRSRRLTPKEYVFPWRYIDTDNIQVEDYLTRPFGFSIDQDRILDLLTGHTLYNDSSVVIRELAQNAIDAVRLQSHIEGSESDLAGNVRIVWDSRRSELTVTDNGTGMTQEVVENHLLKVGSSRYQSQKFRDAYPNFSPISRFGIGVLSSFMVADSVEIITVSPDEDQARQISLRSVHGKYLIRLLDKHGQDEARAIGAHGTSLKLTFRPSARKIDVLETVRKWVLFPRCNVSVCVDGAPAEKVGYSSPKAALEDFIGRPDKSGWRGSTEIKVEERSVGGLTLAFALGFNSHFRDWSFVSLPERG